MPPPDGWPLPEAAAVFSPRFIENYRRRSPDSEIDDRAARTGYQQFFSIREELLTSDVVKALCERLDLQLTGYPRSAGVYAKKIAVPQAQLNAALWGSRNPLERPTMEIAFSLVRNKVQLIYHEPNIPGGYKSEVLFGPRIETATVSDLVSPMLAHELTHVSDRDREPRDADTSIPRKPITQKVSQPAFRAWFRLYVARHSQDQSVRSERVCVADARKEFGPKVSREMVRLARRELAPHWLKKGPKPARN